MSEFGGLTVARSEDFKGDLKAICDALNRIGIWDGDDEKFQIVNTAFGAHIAFSVRTARLPTVFPLSSEKIDAEEYAAKLENREPVFGDDVCAPFEQICNSVSRHIEVGELTVAVVRYEGNYLVNFERLKVRADGGGERASAEYTPVRAHETLEVV